MGTWGAGAFENDTALDFAAEIRTAKDLADALTIRTPDDAWSVGASPLSQRRASPEAHDPHLLNYEPIGPDELDRLLESPPTADD